MIATKNLIHAVVMSNLHLDPESRAWLDNQAELNTDAHNIGGNHIGGQISTLGATMCGWFSHAPALADGNDNEIPAVLATLYRYARALGCAYILFDADAEEIDGLPVFDFESTKPGKIAGKSGGVVLVDEIGFPDAHMVTVNFVDGPQQVFAPYGVDMGGQAMDRPIDRPDLPSLAQLANSYAETHIETKPVLSADKLREIRNFADGISPVIIPFSSTDPVHFTQSGRRALDKAGHAVIGRSQAQELKEAVAAILEEVDNEIEQRKHSHITAYWDGLQVKADRLREAVKALNG